MFIDETVLIVEAGKGGNGCWAYERAKYKPNGPPAGGDGGHGGNVYIRGNAQMHTLQDLAYRKRVQSGSGTHGQGSNKYGRAGEDATIDVPLGTIVYDEATGEVLLDCVAEGESIIIARGGRPGRGNASLVSRKNPHPERAQEGYPGEKKRLRLELKVLADVGLVGRPNAGKSTFLSRISHAHPKIADYPFTTLTPNLGIVAVGEGYSSFVVADIPGLIEGSHTGKGLGIKFLKHIERTRVLAILVESTSENPSAEAKVLLAELKAYDPGLARKPAIRILTKTDLLPPDKPPVAPRGWLAMSAVTGKGVTEVLRKFEKMLAAAAESASAEEALATAASLPLDTRPLRPSHRSVEPRTRDAEE